VFTVTVRGITVAGFEDEEDTDGNQNQTNVGADPVETLVLGETVDEQANGQPNSSAESSVQTRLGIDDAVGVGSQGLVLADLEEVQTEANGGSDIGKTGDTLAPAPLLLESDRNHGQEKESKEPGETNPKSKGEDNGLREQHLDSLDGGVVQHLFDTRGLEVVVGNESLITGRLAESLCTLGEGNTSTGLDKEDSNDDHERDVSQTLNTLNPTPAKSLVNETSVDGCGNGTKDGNEGERGHRDSTVLGSVHITKGTADKNSTNATEETEKGTADKDSSNVLAQGETDEHESEANIGTDVDDSSTGKLTKWSQEERSKRTSEVEAEQSKLANLSRGSQVFCHACNSGTIGCCGETNEECHQTEKSTDESLVGSAPVEGVLLVCLDKLKDDELLSIVFGRPGHGERHVDVDFL
jgi:hypothetical protein